jgi:transcriptional regulator with XRE-family HTH domain
MAELRNRGYSQSHIAEQLGCNQQWVSWILQGGRD